MPINPKDIQWDDESGLNIPESEIQWDEPAQPVQPEQIRAEDIQWDEPQAPAPAGQEPVSAVPDQRSGRFEKALWRSLPYAGVFLGSEKEGVTVGRRMVGEAGAGVADILRNQARREQVQAGESRIPEMMQDKNSPIYLLEKSGEIDYLPDELEEAPAYRQHEYIQKQADDFTRAALKYADYMPKPIQQKVHEGGVLGFLEDAAVGMARFAGPMAISWIRPDIGFVATYHSYAGSKYDEYKQQGYSDREAFEGAQLAATLGAPVELAGNLAQFGVLKAVLKTPGGNKLIQWLSKGAAKYIKSLLASGIAEGGEEITQAFTDAAVDIHMAMPNASEKKKLEALNELRKDPQWLKETGYQGAVGAAGGMMLQSPGVAYKGTFNTAKWLIDKGYKKKKVGPDDSTDLLTGKTESAVPEAVRTRDDAQQILNRVQKELTQRINEAAEIPPEAIEEMPDVPGAPTAEELGIVPREIQEAQRREEGLPILPEEAIEEVPETRIGAPAAVTGERPVAELPSRELELEERTERGPYGPGAYRPEEIPKKEAPTGRGRFGPEAGPKPGEAKRAVMKGIRKEPVAKEPKKDRFDEYVSTLSETERSYIKDIIKAEDMPVGERLDLAKNEIQSRKAKEKARYQKDLKIAEKETEIPTPAQIKSGTYKKGRIKVHGFDAVIETPKGVERLPGRPVKHPVGYLSRTEGADGDQVDAIFGPLGETTNTFVVDQLNKDGSFDEHKIMIGFKNEGAARTAHKTTYGDRYNIGRIVEMTPSQLKKFVNQGNLKRPAAAQPPISESEWKRNPEVRPAGYLTKRFIPDAKGKHAQATNRAIIAEYRQWLKNMGYFKPSKKTQAYERQIEAKRKDKRSAPIRSFEKQLMAEVPGAVSFGDVREVTDLNEDQNAAKEFADALGVDLAFFDMDYEYGASGVFTIGPNTIVIRANTPKPSIFVLTHEVMHNIEEEDPELYEKLRRHFWDRIIPAEYEMFANALNSKRIEDGQEPLPLNPWTIENKGKHTVFDEYLPEFAGHQVFKKEFWDRLQKKDPTTFGKVLNYIARLFHDIVSKISHTKTELLHYFYQDRNELTNAIADAFVKFAKRPIRAGQMRKAETIRSAAIMTQAGEIFIGPTHFDAFNMASEAGADLKSPLHEGFITSEGRFVGREEALKIAEAAKQLSETGKKLTGKKGLISEAVEGLSQKDIDVGVFWRGTKQPGTLKKKPGRPAYYFMREREWAEEYGTTEAFRLNVENTFDFRNPDHIKIAVRAIKKIPGFQPWMERDLRAGDWEMLEKPQVVSAIKDAGFDSYITSEAGGAIGVFEKDDIVPIKPTLVAPKFQWDRPQNAIDPKFQVDFDETININKSHKNYSSASDEIGDKAKNILVRPGKKQGKYLFVQISSGGNRAASPVRNSKEGIGDKYFNKLYETRPGYVRPADFWEIPEWAAMAAKTFKDSDFYVIRNLGEAKEFLRQSDYKSVMFSVLDANKTIVKDIVSDYPGNVIASGYIRKNYFDDNKNVKFVNSIEEAAKELGEKYERGVDYKHFGGTQTIPRLELSRGCLHGCAFCVVPKKVIEANDEFIDEQIESFKDLDFSLIYLNDKTFGQAKNYKKLTDLNKRVREINPKFDGFIIQTTAPAFLKMDENFLKEAGIKYVELGVETYNDDILKKLKKPHDTKLIDRAVQKIRRLNINFVPNLIVGLAGVEDGKIWTETKKSYQNTLDFLNKNDDIISHVNAYVLATYEGTTLAGQLGVESEEDADENVIEKSWLKNKAVHEKFYKDIMEFGINQLDKSLYKIEPMRYQVDFVETIPAQAKITAAKKPRNNGQIGSPLGNKLKWLIPEMVRDAVKKESKKPKHLQVRDFLSVRKEWRGFGITEDAVKTFTNQAKNYLSGGKILEFKNKKEYDEVKKFREEIATGMIEYGSPEYNRMIKKYGEKLQLHTVKHEVRFPFSTTKSYGPIDDADIRNKVTKEHPIRGEFETTVITDPETGNLVVNGPLFSKDRPVRIQQIIDIVNKNKHTWGWYEEWNRFMSRWKDKIDSEKIVKYIKIQAVLSAQKGPQGNQLLFAQVVDQLEKGYTGKMEGTTGEQEYKIKRIWNGLDDETTLEEFVRSYGRKVGPYMFVGLHPMQREVVVIDRHMPKPWGYNIMWSPRGMEADRMQIAPEVAAEVAGDIMTAAEELNIPYGSAQAALWFEIREDDVEAATYGEAAQIKPDEYLPGVMYAHTVPETLGEGIHYKKTLMKPGDFVYGATADGRIQYNTYSRNDIQKRIDAGTEKNPYAQLVYAYEAAPGFKPEQWVEQGREAHIVDFAKSRIYDGVNDILGYLDSARKRIEEDPGVPIGLKIQAVTNAFANLIKDSGSYDGFSYKQGNKVVIALFEGAAIKHGPDNITLALSDVVEDIESIPQKISELEKLLPERAMNMISGLKTMVKNHTGLSIERIDSTIARFGDVTSGSLEIGAMVRARGPAATARVFGSEWGVAKGQNYVFVLRRPDPGETPTGQIWSIPVSRSYEKPSDLEEKILEYGLSEINIGVKESSGRLFIEQYFANTGEWAPSDEDIERFANFVEDVGESGVEVERADAVSDVLEKDNYKDILTGYYGEKEGSKLYEDAIKRQEKYFDKIKERSFGEDIREERKKDKKDRGPDEDGTIDDGPIRKQEDLPRIVPDRKRIFYSDLRNYVLSNKFQPGRPGKVKAFLEQQMRSKAQPFKQEEWDWSNVGAWLDLQPDTKKITGQDIADFMDKYSIRFKELYRGAGAYESEEEIDHIRSHYFQLWYDSEVENYEIRNLGVDFDIAEIDNWPDWARKLFEDIAKEEWLDISEPIDPETGEYTKSFDEMVDIWNDGHIVIEPYSGNYPDGEFYGIFGNVADISPNHVRSEYGAVRSLDDYLDERWTNEDDDFLVELFGENAREDLGSRPIEDEDEDVPEHLGVTEEAKWGHSGYNIPGGQNYREMQVIIESPETDYTILQDMRSQISTKMGVIFGNLEQGYKRFREKLDLVFSGVQSVDSFISQLRTAVREEEGLEKKDREDIQLAVTQAENSLNRYDQKVKEFGAKKVPIAKEFGFEVPAHWDETDVLYHVRFDTRYGPNKEKVLFIQELQSDWHQQGGSDGYRGLADYKIRKVGKVKKYNTLQEFKNEFDWPVTVVGMYNEAAVLHERPVSDEDRNRLEKANKNKKFSEDDPVWVVIGEDGKPKFATMVSSRIVEERADMYEAVDPQGKIVVDPRNGQPVRVESKELMEDYIKERTNDLVPDAPFKTNWYLQAFKRIVRYAAEANYDYIAMTTGEQQVERWNQLLKKVHRIEYEPDEKTLLGYDPNGTLIIEKENVNENELDDYIGKDSAERLMSSEKTLAGFHWIEEIKIGGRFLRNLYNKKIPRDVNKMFNKKKWGKAKMGFDHFVVTSDGRLYTQEGLRRDYPTFTGEPEVVKKMTGYEPIISMPVTDEMKERALTEGQPLYNKDLEVTIDPSAKEVIEKKIAPKRGRTIREKIINSMEDARENWQTRMFDRLHPIKKWMGEGKAYMLARGIPGIQSTFNAFLEHGKLTFDESGALITETVKEGFLPWYDRLGRDGEKFFYWVVAKRAESLQKQEREFLFSNQDIKKILDWVGPRPTDSPYNSWEEINREFKEFNESILDIAQRSGLIDKDFRDYMASQGYYVPFYRILEDEESRTNFIVKKMRPKEISSQIRKLTGSEKPIGDPIENMLRNWGHLISESVHNTARRSAFNTAVRGKLIAYRDADGNDVPLVERVSWADTVRFKKIGKDKDAPTFIHKKEGVPVLQFRAAGKNIYFKVNDPELFNALGQMDVPAFDNLISIPFTAGKRLLTMGATFGPAFRVKNFLRDTLHTFQISKGFIPLWDSVAGLWKVIRKDPDYIRFMASGMAFGGSYIREADPRSYQKFVKNIVRKEGSVAKRYILDTPAKLLQFWNHIGEAAENAARVQLYSKLRAKGKSHLEAGFAARDLMDFNMSGNGTAVKVLISTVPFMNARMQGLYKMGRAALENPATFFGKSALIAMASLMLWWFNKDDDRWKELEDFEKFAWYHFWIGDRHYRIPKPFETGVLFSTSMEVAGDVISGNEELSHVWDYVVHAFSETLAFNPTPQLMRPIVEQIANKVFFTGRPIESIAKQRLSPGQRYDPWDSESLRLLGEKLNISPKRAQALIRGYLSTFGMFILGMSDVMVRNFADFPERPTRRIDDYPLIGSFVRQAEDPRYTKYMSSFYDVFREINQIASDINNYEREGDLETARKMTNEFRDELAFRKRLNRTYKQLSDLSVDIKKTWTREDMTPDKKKERIDDLTQRRNELVRKVYNEYKKEIKK